MGGMTKPRRSGPLHRLTLLRRLRVLAAWAGMLDEAGELDDASMALLKQAREEARAADCDPGDVDEMTMDGLAEGRVTRRGDR